MTVVERVCAGLAVAEYGPDPAPSARPTLVLLPSLGLSGRSWAGPAEILGRRYRCLAVDPPGQGRSDPPVHFMTVPDLADAVAAVVETDGADRVVVVGNSMGASIAAQLAVSRPDLVEAVVLVGAFVNDDEASRREWLHSRSSTLLNPYGGLRPMDAATVEAIFGEYRPEWHRMILSDHIDCQPVMGASMWALYSFDMVAALGQLTQPVLSAFGENDQLRSPSSPLIRERVKDLTEAVIPGGSHLTTVDQPQALAHRIQTWIEQQGERSE